MCRFQIIARCLKWRCDYHNGPKCVAIGRRRHSVVSEAHRPRYATSAETPASATSSPVTGDTQPSTGSFIKNKLLSLAYGSLTTKVDGMLSQLKCSNKVKDDAQIRVGFLGPWNLSTASTFATFFSRANVTLSMLPLPNFILRNNLHDPEYEQYFQKHAADVWKCLIVESCLNALVSTREHVDTISPICQLLTVPIFVLTQEPSLLTFDQYRETLCAGHGYFDYLNSKRVQLNEINGIEEFKFDSLKIPTETSKLHCYTQIAGANVKACVHTYGSILNQVSTASRILEFQKGAYVFNCLIPHDISSFILGILVPLKGDCTILFPLKHVPLSQFTNFKVKYPIISNVALPQGLQLHYVQSILDTLGANKDKNVPSYLLCHLDLLRGLLSYVSHKDLWQAERERCLDKLASIKQIVITCTLQEMQMGDVESALKVDGAADMLKSASLLVVVTMPQVGIVAWKHISSVTDKAEYLQCPGVSIKGDYNSYSINVSSDALFKEYFRNTNCTRMVLNNGTFSETFERPIGCRKLLDMHKEYVSYFKRKRERMRRYPQGYIKSVAIRTQFWGNFTGKHKHHSVL